ncbi:uncharacterized protein LOC119555085 [Drosophila subpulchrella]|uniref:uncharacterized protein LOC119555085 n=1 Tax=Drosophila subpulchrella TaxID=1486046 RepID=UPI0018A1A18D|nr:uncharacterized protein LOC119555085 [Drosophila subpulchrella]
MVFVPVSTTLGIDIEWKKPKKFKSAAEEKSWMHQSRKEAREIRLDLESGRLKPKDMPGRILVEPNPNLVPSVEAKRFQKELFNRKGALTTERNFVNLFTKLANSLQSWDPDKALRVLIQMKKMKLTKLMLLRNPDCVTKTRDLREFGGEEEEFQEHDMVIRQKSTELYAKFKKMFSLGPDPEDSFWEHFCEQVDVFNALTKDMKTIFRTTLSDQGYKRLLDAEKASVSSISVSAQNGE